MRAQILSVFFVLFFLQLSTNTAHANPTESCPDPDGYKPIMTKEEFSRNFTGQFPDLERKALEDFERTDKGTRDAYKKSVIDCMLYAYNEIRELAVINQALRGKCTLTHSQYRNKKESIPNTNLDSYNNLVMTLVDRVYVIPRRSNVLDLVKKGVVPKALKEKELEGIHNEIRGYLPSGICDAD